MYVIKVHPDIAPGANWDKRSQLINIYRVQRGKIMPLSDIVNMIGGANIKNRSDMEIIPEATWVALSEADTILECTHGINGLRTPAKSVSSADMVPFAIQVMYHACTETLIVTMMQPCTLMPGRCKQRQGTSSLHGIEAFSDPG